MYKQLSGKQIFNIEDQELESGIQTKKTISNIADRFHYK